MPREERVGGQAGEEEKGQDSCLELLGVIEADTDRGHHPGVKERLQDVPGHGVGHQVEVQWVFPWGGMGGGEESWEAPKGTTWDQPHPRRLRGGNTHLAILARLLSCLQAWPPLPPTPGLPVEEQGLDQRDDISAGVVASTHDRHVQELGEGGR